MVGSCEHGNKHSDFKVLKDVLIMHILHEVNIYILKCCHVDLIFVTITVVKNFVFKNGSLYKKFVPM